MKTEKNILVAFLLNFGFALFEFIGGILTGSFAILSDAVHDIGDAASIGVSFFLEKKSKRQPDKRYSYGYARYSAVGSLITNLILIIGSALIVYHAVQKFFAPSQVHATGMIVLAVVGVCVNLAAAIFTKDSDSLNQKAVNLHMIEDVLGWAVVLVGAIVIKLTNFYLIDPLLSIGVAAFILVHAFGNLKEVFALFLEKTPHGVCLDEITERVCQIDEVRGVHHLHVWSLDGNHHYATMHVVSNDHSHKVKEKIRATLKDFGIVHATLEFETENEHCSEENCHVETECSSHHHHHHHSHHH